MINRKIVTFAVSISIFILSVLIFPAFSGAAPVCPLSTGQAYKTTSSKSVYYVTTNCTKRSFLDSSTYYTYFKSFKSVKKDLKNKLAQIPVDEFSVMVPKIPGCALDTNIAYKTSASKAIYFVTPDCTKRAFPNADVYYSYFSSFKSVKKVSVKSLNKISLDSAGAMISKNSVVLGEKISGVTKDISSSTQGGLVSTSSVTYVAPVTQPSSYYSSGNVGGGGGGGSVPTLVPIVPPLIVAPTFTPIIIPATTSYLVATSSQNTSTIKLIGINYKYGLSVASTLSSLSLFELNKRLDDFVSLGIGYIRVDMNWNNIQNSNSSTYYWSVFDNIVSSTKKRNIKILPMLAYTPKWARPGNCQMDPACAPANSNAFAKFAAAAVKRYSAQGIHTWEIWNEPNSKGFWKPVADPIEYSNLLKAAYLEIKKVDPSAIVITGGMAPKTTGNGNYSPIDFLTLLYKNGIKSYFDALGHHPYTFPLTANDRVIWNSWYQMNGTVPSLRSIMSDNGDSNKVIWLTEVGAPTGGPGSIATRENLNLNQNPDHVDDSLQAKILYDAMLNYQNLSSVGPIFWYSYRDAGISSSTRENFFGLLRYDGSKKPAYGVLKALIASSTVR